MTRPRDPGDPTMTTDSIPCGPLHADPNASEDEKAQSSSEGTKGGRSTEVKKPKNPDDPS